MTVALGALLLLGALRQAAGQGTAFTYQGQLNQGGNPANGSFDLRFSLFPTNVGGASVAGFITNSATAVNNGLFTVVLDFGAGILDGTTYWLQIGVRTNGGAGFTALSPRQQLTPSPYTIYSETSGLATEANSLASGTVSVSQLNTIGAPGSGQVLGFNGSSLVWTNPSAASPAWNLTGNAGTTPANFLGTTDNQGLQLRSANKTGLQLQYIERGSLLSGLDYAMNIIAGYWGNTILSNAVGATIAGGGEAFRAGINFGETPNIVSGDFGTVGGGWGNTAGYAAAIPGGFENTATGIGSFAAGQWAQTTHNNTFLWGDGSQTPFTGASADNAFNVLATGGVFFYDGANGVHVDGLGNNDGTLDFGLKFGGSLTSGEGIASKRTAGGNQYGLDFYTRSANQMSIERGGALRVYDNDIYLRTTADANHDGLAYRTTFAGFNFDGPLLWGFSGGALGTVVPNEVSLTWDFNGNVWISNNCSVAGLTIRGGADVAEPFEITADDNQVPPGCVVVIDAEHPGHLKLSSAPYDTRVAGVVSGANGIHPGIQMQQQGLLEGGKNVALTGRVYVQASSSNGAIQPGDLLTTSTIPGHAMKVTDHARAQGAILGKAMTGLSDGSGMVLVLVTLQ